MTMNILSQSVEALMRQVARDIVIPRYQNLSAHEIEEKAADDYVTIADKESELRLSEGLGAILPDAAMIGEEAAAADPSILDRAGIGLNWIIDPIDGTGNFAAGKPPFGIMIALVDGGVTQAGWILDPLTGRFCEASLGGGAFIDGKTVKARDSGEAMPIAAFAVHFMTPEKRADIQARSNGNFTVVDIPRCAAEQYPRLVLGQNDVSVFERTLPWDHAAGALFLNEAGGRICRNDGSEYRISDGKRGLLGASSPRIWDAAARILFG
jgi:fructose-1,6-bisphosphatase/inositol monophosphatase family enzyme